MEAKNFKLEKIGNIAIINDDMVVDMSKVDLIAPVERDYPTLDLLLIVGSIRVWIHQSNIDQNFYTYQPFSVENDIYHLQRELVNFKKELAKLADLTEQKTLALAQLNKEELENQPIEQILRSNGIKGTLIRVNKQSFQKYTVSKPICENGYKITIQQLQGISLYYVEKTADTNA